MCEDGRFQVRSKFKFSFRVELLSAKFFFSERVSHLHRTNMDFAVRGLSRFRNLM